MVERKSHGSVYGKETPTEEPTRTAPGDPAASRRRWPWLVGVAVVLVGVGLLAPAITPETAQAREPFPVDFALPDLQGHIMRLSYRRGQVVWINFWATWCYPCRVEMPSMHALYQDYREKGFEILAISICSVGHETHA